MLKNSGNKVLLAAADTFRAAATDQLQTWAERIKTEIVLGKSTVIPPRLHILQLKKLKQKVMII